jgi:hypothetical protein
LCLRVLSRLTVRSSCGGSLRIVLVVHHHSGLLLVHARLLLIHRLLSVAHWLSHHLLLRILLLHHGLLLVSHLHARLLVHHLLLIVHRLLHHRLLIASHHWLLLIHRLLVSHLHHHGLHVLGGHHTRSSLHELMHLVANVPSTICTINLLLSLFGKFKLGLKLLLLLHHFLSFGLESRGVSRLGFSLCKLSNHLLIVCLLLS